MGAKSGISGRNVFVVPHAVPKAIFAGIPDKLTAFGLNIRSRVREASQRMLRAIVTVLLILWLLGFVLHIAGGIIHLLAVIAVVVLIYDIIARKKRVG